MSIDDIRENIVDNTYLSDSAKSELLNKLDEIEDLQKSKESKAKNGIKQKQYYHFCRIKVLILQ